MKTLSLLTLLMVVLFPASQTSPTSANAQAEKEVRHASDQEVQAFVHNDPKTMARPWSDDMVVTNPLNKFVNKQQAGSHGTVFVPRAFSFTWRGGARSVDFEEV